MDAMYPGGPADVPAGLTAPTRAYRRHAWLAMGGLLAFVAAYLGLMAWLASTAVRLLSGLVEPDAPDPLVAGLVGGGAAFLAVFMAKALFFVRRGEASRDLEITAAEQPRLFAFLHRLADEAGAPRPHRVYLSARVNAAVFYDLSLANLLLPSRKNLEIGLALVNVLDLSEFKAVLAHEFGHFAQRTMAVGRWVYVAHQVAGHLVERRDALDAFLVTLTRLDLRVAWIGWVLQLVVWSIRSLVDLMFRVVVLAQRALSREMEFQADLVAVALTGSDALVHALHKLAAADDAWDRAVAFAHDEQRRDRPAADLFVVQQRILEKLREIHADPEYGAAPPLPEGDRSAHRVFRTELAAPPRMWATHPANADRENNAKRTYLACAADPRSAWALFDDAGALRRTISGQLMGEAGAAPADPAETLARIDAAFDRLPLRRRYRGAHLGRAIGRDHPAVASLTGETGARLDAARPEDLYPDELGADIERLRELEDELATLRAVEAGWLKAPGGVLRWRGDTWSPRALPRILAELQAEIAPLREALATHDRTARAVHLGLADRLGNGWPEALRGLAHVLHYADHVGADLRDLKSAYDHEVAVANADGTVSQAEVRRLLAPANALQAALAAIHRQADAVHLGSGLADALGAEHWRAALGEDGLPTATAENIASWSRAVHGWVGAATGALSALSSAALERLLALEDEVAALHAAGRAPPAAPEPAAAPADYPRLPRGAERPKRTRLDAWSRFQTASGPAATVGRLAIAGSILGSVVYFAAGFGQQFVEVYNGLSIPVRIEAEGRSVEVGPHANAQLPIAGRGEIELRATTTDGREVERFNAKVEGRRPHVYNVAGAAALVRWTATYGKATPVPDRELGAPRWSVTQVDHLFSEPPEQIETRTSGGLRTVLSGYSDAPPFAVLGRLGDESRHGAVIAAHARWDATGGRHALAWLLLAARQPGFPELLRARIAEAPDDVVLLRLEQDAADETARAAVCARHTEASRVRPADAGLRYLAIRCMDDEAARDAAFEQAHLAQPGDGWLANAAGLASAERMHWREAASRLQVALAALPVMTDRIATELVRIERASAEDLGIDAAALAARAPELAWELDVESGRLESGDPQHAYALLAAGRPDDAVAAAEPDDDLRPRIVRLAAASDGASRTLVARALALDPGAGIDRDSVWAALALSRREGASSEPIVAALSARADVDPAPMLAFLEALETGSPEAAEAQLGPVSPRVRGLAYAAGVVRLGARAPAAWRQLSQRLLFASERPDLR